MIRETVTLGAPEVRTYAALELRSEGDDGRWLEGRAVPFGVSENVGWFLEEHMPGSFDRSIREAASSLPLLLWHENRTFPVGKADTWKSTDDGLDGVWRMDDSPEAARAHQLARDGMLVGLSIGFVPIRSKWEQVADDEWNPDLGPEHMDKVIRLESRLLEVSMTPTPAFAGAQVSLVRSRDHRQRANRDAVALREWRKEAERLRSRRVTS